MIVQNLCMCEKLMKRAKYEIHSKSELLSIDAHSFMTLNMRNTVLSHDVFDILQFKE